MSRDPNHSHDLDLSPEVATRWWGPSKNLDLYWRVPAHNDGIHEDGTPLLRVTGTLALDEARLLYEFLHSLLEGTEWPNG